MTAVTVELDESSQHIVIDAPLRYKELCKRIPGSNWDRKAEHWRLPTSWSACLALRSTFGDQLTIGPRLTQWATDELNTRITPANQLREVTTLDNGDPDLYPHQQAGVAFLAAARQALLADEPGLGKTAQAIRGLARIQKEGTPVFPALIVTPNTIKKNWEREFTKWWPGVNVQVISGTALQRRKQFNAFLDPTDEEPTPHVVVINWESLRSHSRLEKYGSVALKRCKACGGEDEKVTPTQCEVHERELNKIEFQSVIADEIHRSKDPKSKQTRALWAASGAAKIRFALTGTPIANNVTDLWPILHWLNPAEWPKKTAWIDRMVDSMTNAFGGLVVLGVKPQMETEFYSALHPRMRRMLKKVVLPNLPDVVVERRDVEMPAKQKKAYNQMRDNMIAELENGDVLTAPSVLTQSLRLQQFASAYCEIEEVDVVNQVTGEVETKIETTLSEPSGKLDAVMDDIKNGDFGDDSIAISAVSRQLIELLSARLTKEKIDHGLITGAQSAEQRQQAMDDFQEGRIKYILFTAQAGGVGVTLTRARRLIRLQRPWSLVDDKQVNDRVHRIGSEIHDSIIIMDYTAEGTVEERVVDVLDQKGENFEAIVHDQTQLLSLLKDDKAGLL